MLARCLGERGPALALACRAFASNAVAKSDKLQLAREVATTRFQEDPITELPGQAFVGDLRSTSALSIGDGISNHTAKWFQPGLAVSVVHACALGAPSAPLLFIPGLHHPSPALCFTLCPFLCFRPPPCPPCHRLPAFAGQPDQPAGVHPGGGAHQGARPGGGQQRWRRPCAGLSSGVHQSQRHHRRCASGVQVHREQVSGGGGNPGSAGFRLHGCTSPRCGANASGGQPLLCTSAPLRGFMCYM